GERLRLVRHPVEDGRHADGVEARVLEGAEIFGLPHVEPPRATVRTRDADAFFERIDPDDAGFRSQTLANPPCQTPRPAPDIEDPRPLLEPEPLDEAPAPFELKVAHPFVGLGEMPAVARERSRHECRRRASERVIISDHAARPSPKAPACRALRGSKSPT